MRRSLTNWSSWPTHPEPGPPPTPLGHSYEYFNNKQKLCGKNRAIPNTSSSEIKRENSAFVSSVISLYEDVLNQTWNL